MTSITSANAILIIGVPDLFPVAQQIQGFATDDVYSTDPIEAAETMMGVDGRLSGGFVHAPRRIGYALMADSPSIELFDAWHAAERQIQDLYYANGSITLPSMEKKYTLTKGILTNWPAMPDAGKTLRPRKFTIVWERMDRAPL